MHRLQLKFDDETLAAVERQMQRYGIGNRTDLLRFAVRVLDASPQLTYPAPLPQPEGRPAHRSRIKSVKS